MVVSFLTFLVFLDIQAPPHNEHLPNEIKELTAATRAYNDVGRDVPVYIAVALPSGGRGYCGAPAGVPEPDIA